MNLRQLKIAGFKSFAGETTLELSPNLTCIVGPNGSGKSNIIDAISWALGEQGASALRSSKMDDVIFAGTDSKSPLGRARVELVLDNRDNLLSSELSEISVSRTLYRSGQSEYQIGSENCRLLDVQELLSDAGLGREMHGIVGQGQLDSVLRSSPAERRALLEEASGVLKFRRRKERSSRKLESMASNLARLKDIIAEVERTKRALGRQAKTAEQAKILQENIAELKLELYLRKFNQHETHLLSSKAESASIRAELALVDQSLTSLNASLNGSDGEAASEHLLGLRSKKLSVEATENRIQLLVQLSKRELSAVTEYDHEPITETQREMEAALITQVKAIEEELNSLDKQLAEAEMIRQESYSRLESAKQEMDRVKGESERQAAERLSLEQELVGRNEYLQELSSSFDLQSVEKARLIEEINALREKLKKDVHSSTSDGALREAFDLARVASSAAAAALEKARTDLASLEIQLGSALSRKATLTESLSRVLSDGTSALSEKLTGETSELIQVDKGYEGAIATALGVFASGKTVPSKDSGLEVLRLIRDGGLARANLVIAEGPLMRGKDNAPGDLLSAAAVVSAPEALLQHFSNFWVAKTLDEANQHVQQAEAAGKTIVTLNGDLIGSIFLSGGAGNPISSIEISSELENLDAQINKFKSRIDDATKHRTELEQALSDRQRKADDALAELREHDDALAKSAEQAGAIKARVSLLEERVSHLDSQSQELEERMGETVSHVHMLKQRLDDAPTVVEMPQVANFEELDMSLEVAREREVKLRVERGALIERKGAVERELSQTQERTRQAIARAEKERLAAEAFKSRVEALEAVFAIGPKIGLALQRISDSLTSSISSAENERRVRQEKDSQLLVEKSDLEQKKTHLSNNLQSLEMSVYELTLQLTSIEEKVKGELGVSLENLAGSEPNAHADKDVIELERQIAGYESSLSRIGTFNPLAVEEYAALEERYNYLTEQLEDMTKARAELREIIRDIDSTIDSTFSQAFEDTKKEFEEIFPVLFPGGTGSLSLTQPEGDVEPGIEVSIRPAGKRIERMSLLSGGERSLAAMALLVAIFKARPSPFYVLDEVEAALDDVNLERLLKVLKSLGETSQLIIVTHQKKTMEIADALYGVSMGADGVTKVMSQTLEKAS